MRFQIDHDYHIHSNISLCASDPNQTPENILKHAIDNSLVDICLTDHYWDRAVPGASEWCGKQDFDHINAARPLPSVPGVRFMFGCEADMKKDCSLTIPKFRYDEFDFIIISTTHMHMVGYTVSEEDVKSPESIARVWVRRMDALLASDLPFKKTGIAHLAASLINLTSRENYLKTLDLIPTEDMQRIFTRAAELGCGIEINKSDMSFTESEADTVLCMFRIAKACGCKFYLGSDAHTNKEFLGSKKIFERAIDMLGLTEDDKFRV